MSEKIINKSLDIALEKARVKANDNGYKFKGYASVFDGVDSYGDTIKKGAFLEALEKGMPKMFFNHDTYELPIGKWVKCVEDDTGLYVEGELTKGLKEADEVALALKAGTVDGLSIGFSVKADGLEYNEETDGYVITKVHRLREISIVTFPADDSARIEKAESLQTFKDIEHYLRDAGMSATEAKTVISRTKAAALVEFQRDAENEKNTQAEAQILEALERLNSKL